VKRPCNAYIKFIQDFMAKNSSNYDNVCDTVSNGKESSRYLILSVCGLCIASRSADFR